MDLSLVPKIPELGNEVQDMFLVIPLETTVS